MDYKYDSNGHPYLEAPIGWETDQQLRMTYILENCTVRFSKQDENGHIYPGPEPEINNIPIIIEALIKIYNDKRIE